MRFGNIVLFIISIRLATCISILHWTEVRLLLSSLCICTCARHTAWPILNFNDSLRINPFAIFILMYLKSDSRASYDPISFEYSLFLLLSSLNRLCEKKNIILCILLKWLRILPNFQRWRGRIRQKTHYNAWMIGPLWMCEKIKCFMQINCASNVLTVNNGNEEEPVTFPQTVSHSIYIFKK